MSAFQNLKKSSSLEKLTKAVEALNQGEGQSKEENFWKPEVDKAGNGYAVIRFLPAPEVDGDDALPWVKMFSHGFQGPGGWYIENSLTTLNKNDPVSEYNSTLWNSGVEANKEIARKQKRKLSYIANVYIVEDPKHPENNGKVFLFKFGKKIFEKITSAMNPEFEDETPINPFDMWTGANFKLKIRKVEGYPNYDKSEFADAGPLLADDAKMEKIWKSEYPLKDLVTEKNFKSYDALKARLDKVLGLNGDGTQRPQTTVEQAKQGKLPTAKPAVSDADIVGTSDDDEDLKFFDRLANDE